MGILQKEDTTRGAVCPLFLTGEIRSVELSLPLGCLQAFERLPLFRVLLPERFGSGCASDRFAPSVPKNGLFPKQVNINLIFGSMDSVNDYTKSGQEWTSSWLTFFGWALLINRKSTG